MDLQIDVYQVEEKGYYVRIVSNKGHGVAASLYKALESFSTFTLQSSNLATLNDTFLFTFTLNVSSLSIYLKFNNRFSFYVNEYLDYTLMNKYMQSRGPWILLY